MAQNDEFNVIIADNIEDNLKQIGEDPEREGLKKTPIRSAKAFAYLTKGYKQNIDDIITVFDSEGYDQMIILKDIQFYSLCEHHILPFFGKAHVAYIPDKKIVGISKLARITDMFARRLQNQERLTQQIANAIQDKLQPKGVAVFLEGMHLCMRMRGVEEQNATMTTTALRGAFLTEEATRQEFFNSINRK